MSNTNFLPGDRVTNTQLTIDNGVQWGTLIEGTDEFPIRIKFDNDPANIMVQDGARHWRGGWGYVKRQPIEPGCFVRELAGEDVFIDKSPRKVLDVSGGVARFDGQYGTFHVNLKFIARVAEPGPVIETGSVTSADGSFKFDLTNNHIKIGDNAFIDAPTKGNFSPFIPADDHLKALKQAQALATTLYDKHFQVPWSEWQVADDLPGVLLQIDNMTSLLVRKPSASAARDHADLNKLAKFLLLEVPDTKQNPKGAADEAIRIIGELRKRIDELTGDLASTVENNAKLARAVNEAAKVIRFYSHDLHGQKWLEQHAPKPVFKRGDLVTWGAGQIKGRIVGPAPSKDAPWEVIIIKATIAQNGQFITPDLSTLRHAE